MLTLSVQLRYLLTYSYNVVLLYSLGCIHPIHTCQTLITLITLVTESFLTICTDNVNAICATTISSNAQLWCCIAVFPRLYPPNTYLPITDYTDNRVVLSSEQITLTLSVQPRYLLTYSYDIVLLYSLGCIHPIPTCQTLITLITLVTESFLTICTDNVNAICGTTIFSNIQLWYCIAVLLGCIHPIPTCQILITLVKESILTICTDNVNAICATTISSNLQWWYLYCYSP